ncbi:malonic semialdehyde reductase [Sphingomonas sp. MG17]|uniref:Malonic semialdehyde reductase n=1 Tax=Sphingomonas tagetis TaxID=2949092 RepID=A0A9X2HM06_9SPHN|nr:malonic semialdehyde reductase [Sphingomonas tagetis]MCP3732587.1 malonic semialdehyde reductase [Sphingomonas tagetis]
MSSIERDRIANSRLQTASIAQLFTEARSYNRWQDSFLDDAAIREIYEAAAFAPTSANGSPGRFVWVRSKEEKERLAGFVKAGNEIKILQAAATVIVAYDPHFYLNFPRLMPHAAGRLIAMFQSDPVEARETAFRNSSLQGAYLIMAARALGIDCGPMSGFNHDLVNGHYFAGTDVCANFLCCLGMGSVEELYPRGARLTFDEVNIVI